jgi:hypothetical protein
MYERNWPLLVQTGMHIVEHPEAWHQGGWRACFAGHAARLAGCEVAHSSILGDLVVPPEALREQVSAYAKSSMWQVPTAMWHIPWPTPVAHVAHVAEAALRLRPCDSMNLFSASNSIADIRFLLGQWAEQDGVTLPPELRPQPGPWLLRSVMSFGAPMAEWVATFDREPALV